MEKRCSHCGKKFLPILLSPTSDTAETPTARRPGRGNGRRRSSRTTLTTGGTRPRPRRRGGLGTGTTGRNTGRRTRRIVSGTVSARGTEPTETDDCKDGRATRKKLHIPGPLPARPSSRQYCKDGRAHRRNRRPCKAIRPGVNDCKEMTCFSFLPFPAILRTVDGPIEDIVISKTGERYGAFRIVNPRADEAMVRSMKKYGQMSPVVCVMVGDGYELVDGFKRLRACRHMGKETLKARVIEATERVLKAAIIQLNRGRSISEIEEAMVLSSLYRETDLPRRRSLFFWAGTRAGYREGYPDREASRRCAGGYQARASSGKRGPGTRHVAARQPEGGGGGHHQTQVLHEEAAKLIAYLLSRPRWDYHPILARPWEVVGPREPRPAGSPPGSSPLTVYARQSHGKRRSLPRRR